MHIRYDYLTAHDCGVKEHAQECMRNLGITYTHSTPQSLGDQFWFWNCKNVPDPLPKYLTELKADPMECIGFGLSREEAIEIIYMGNQGELKYCPFCGGSPSFSSERVTYGHGDIPTEWSVSCKCGIRTRGIPTGYEGNDEDCKKKAALIWNARI